MNGPADDRAEATARLRELADRAFLELKLSLAESDISTDDQARLLGDLTVSVEQFRRTVVRRKATDDDPTTPTIPSP